MLFNLLMDQVILYPIGCLVAFVILRPLVQALRHRPGHLRMHLPERDYAAREADEGELARFMEPHAAHRQRSLQDIHKARARHRLQ